MSSAEKSMVTSKEVSMQSCYVRELLGYSLTNYGPGTDTSLVFASRTSISPSSIHAMQSHPAQMSFSAPPAKSGMDNANMPVGVAQIC
jgi:hypothetical protein